MSNFDKFEERRKKHDAKEEEAMGEIRPFTVRKHIPDRFVALKNVGLCAWDMKTNVFVEKNSHDEYFRVFQHDGIPVFIVYLDSMGRKFANWIQSLKWDGPKPPSPRSTSGDPYYVISGGIPLMEFLKRVTG